MYCRECGQKLTLRFCENEGLIPYCATCQAYMFPQFPIAVSMVVTNRAQDKILLAKHVEDEDFILFAGYIKKGENAEKTIPREIKEEIGLDVVKAKYMSSRYHAKKEILMLNFIVVVEDKTIKQATGGGQYHLPEDVKDMTMLKVRYYYRFNGEG
ncbi:MAG: NUDIX domain-containing protein, partial [Clostridia bacterium]|nr:NUDIX domain-containing protein [Clostridia bacterium]